MGIIDRLTRSRNKSVAQPTKEKGITINDQSSLRSASSWYSSHYDFYKGATYDNAYPSIKAISNAFLTIKPYAIDVNGEKMESSRLTDVLARPVIGMSGADFREALAVSVLSHRKTYLLVWRAERGQALAGGRITRDNFTGFSFIENAEIKIDKQGFKTYKIDNGLGDVKVFNENEVIEISGGYDPDDLNAGYAPSVSVKKWANVDDYIVDYQAGFFENGAVPAGQFVITAGSPEQFNAIVDEMQRKHRSSGQNNNVQYVHRPISADGVQQAPQVEWIPFSQPNNQLGLKEIFEETNKKIDSAFGVPSSIRGVNDNNTYASVKVDEQIFMKYTVKPFATKIWTKFVSEMNRITGGLGYALSFDIEMPNVADEEKVNAERKKTELDLILTAKNAGYTLDSIITAFGLNDSYKALEMAQNEQIEDNSEVDEGGENETAPDPRDLLPKAVSHSCTCEHCRNGEKHKAIDLEGEELEERIAELVAVYGEQRVNDFINYAFASEDIVEISPDSMNEYLTAVDTSREENKTSHTAEAVALVILAYMLNRGKTQYTDGIRLVNDKLNRDSSFKLPDILVTQRDGRKELDLKNLPDYSITEDTKASYISRLSNIMLSYDRQVSEQIKNALRSVANEAIANDRPIRADVITEKLKDIANEVGNISEYKVRRIAITEENHARQMSQIDAMKDLSNKIGIKVYKKWIALGSQPCEFCQEMNGTVKELDEAFVPYMGVMNGKDGGVLKNTYASMEAAQAHPNCQCKLKFIFEGEE